MGEAAGTVSVSHKSLRNGQTRMGSARRRRLEFAVIQDQVKRRKAAFISRLEKRLRPDGDCLIYQGTLDHKGYARMNFRYQGGHVSIHVQRVALILQLGTPIPRGIEAGHLSECRSRCCIRHVRSEHYKENASTCHSS